MDQPKLSLSEALIGFNVGGIRVIPRRDTRAGWASVDPLLRRYEVGVEVDTGAAKVGDGVRCWTEIPYALESLIEGPNFDTKDDQ